LVADELEFFENNDTKFLFDELYQEKFLRNTGLHDKTLKQSKVGISNIFS